MPKVISDITERITDAAQRLFASQGFGAVDMRSVAREAGIAVGTLYNYYPDKDALFTGVMHTRFRAFHAHVKAGLGRVDGEGQRLPYLLTELHAFIGANQGLWVADGHSRNRGIIGECIALLTEEIRRARGNRGGSDEDAWIERAGIMLAGVIPTLAGYRPGEDGENLAFAIDMAEAIVSYGRGASKNDG